MAQPQQAARKQPESTSEVVADLWDLLKRYAVQETVDPLRNLGRFVGFGSGAAVCWGIAGTLLAVGVMRLLQSEASGWINGNWSWIPYVVGLVISSGIAYVSIDRIKKGKNP